MWVKLWSRQAYVAWPSSYLHGPTVLFVVLFTFVHHYLFDANLDIPVRVNTCCQPGTLFKTYPRSLVVIERIFFGSELDAVHVALPSREELMFRTPPTRIIATIRSASMTDLRIRARPPKNAHANEDDEVAHLVDVPSLGTVGRFAPWPDRFTSQTASRAH
eukprot:scaffold6070_cov295-Pinguiococcus_pyrenoidosus.AAC.14